MTGREATYRPKLAESLEKIATAQRLLVEVECNWSSLCLALGMERPTPQLQEAIMIVEKARMEFARLVGFVEIR